MIEDAILPLLHARLARELAPPGVPLVRLEADGALVGELTEARATRVAGFADLLVREGSRIAFAPGCASSEARTAAMDRVARTLAAEGALSAWRDERYEVRPIDGGPTAFLLERAAARYFGIRTRAVHVNGLVDTGSGIAVPVEVDLRSCRLPPGLSIGTSIRTGAGSLSVMVARGPSIESRTVDSMLAAK